MWTSAALRLSSLLLCSAAFLGCGSSGPDSCQALEKCCASLEGPESASCRDGLDQALGSGASEADLDAACAGSLHAFSAAGSCEAPDAPAGGLRLEVLASSFLPRIQFERSRLLILISLGNGSGGAQAFLSPTFFTVGTEGGVGVAAQLTSEFSPSCAPDLAVLADGEVQCLLLFAVPSGLMPVSLSYTNPDGRLARAPIPKCGPMATNGALCAEGEVCTAGACAAPCSSEVPTGACAYQEDRCIRGACTSPCGAASPDGFCEAGTCVDGICDQACFQTSDLTAECAVCFSDSGCAQGGMACEDECLDCLWEPTPSGRCACQAEVCDGCLAGMSACLRRACPRC